MTSISHVEIYLAALAAAVWGFGCGAFERIVLAPRRRLTALGPAYGPAMILALLAGALCVTSEGCSFRFALLMAGLFFGIGALAAFASFHFARLVLRTPYHQVAEPGATPNSRPPSQLPSVPEVQSSDSRRTPSSGGCG
jgi:hypothetical protein